MADRILIYGVTGSGKTTLAAELARRTGLPWHSVDDLTWQPGWIPVAEDEQRRRIAEICAADRWILDTAYAIWRDIPLARAELVVGLDYPRWFSLGRLVRRTLGRAIDHRLVCNNNTESWREVFSRKSIVLWHCQSFARKRRTMRQWATDPDAPEVVLLTSARQTRAWLAAQPVASTPG